MTRRLRPKRPTGRLAAAAALPAAAGLALVAGCGAAETRRDWTGAVDTLPNGVVRVTNPALGAWGDGGGWRLEPELTIGEVDGPAHEIFSQIIGLEVGDDGRIYVLDRQANELRIFTRDGRHERTVGRTGRGPGEFVGANGLAWLASDTLVVVDSRGARYSIHSRDGAFVRSVPRTLPFYGWAFAGGVENGRIYETSGVGDGPDWRPALFGTALRDGAPASVPASTSTSTSESAPTGLATQPADPADAPAPPRESAPDTVLLPLHPAPRLDAFSVRSERGGMVFAVPHAPGDVFQLDGRGGVWHGHTGAFRVFHSTLAGDTLREIVLRAPPVPVTSADLAEWEALEHVQQFRALGGRIDMERIPRTKPYFDRLHVDPDGHLWVGVPAGPSALAFAVFDPGGHYLGRLEVAGLQRESYHSPIVRDGRLHVVASDTLGVQRVHVFRIVW